MILYRTAVLKNAAKFTGYAALPNSARHRTYFPVNFTKFLVHFSTVHICVTASKYLFCIITRNIGLQRLLIS